MYEISYLGSTISSYGLGFIADASGWMAVFYALLGFCVIICTVCTGYIITKRVMKKHIYD